MLEQQKLTRGDKICLVGLAVAAAGLLFWNNEFQNSQIDQMQAAHTEEMAECQRDAAEFGGVCEYETKTDKQGTPLSVEVVRKN